MRYAAIRRTLVTATLLFALTGCKSDYDRALEKAKADAVATGQPQQIISVDKNGNTLVTLVQPAAVPAQPPVVTSNTTAPGAPLTAGQPDWSNGARPAPGNTVVFIGPKTAPAQLPGTAATTPATGSVVPPGGDHSAPAVAGPAEANQTAPAEADEAAPSNFVPTNVTIPAGTGIAIRINQTISAKHSHAGDRFTGSLAERISRDGKVVLPRGTRFNGVVTEAHRRGHFKGRSYLGLRLTSLVYQGKVYPIETAGITRTKKGKGKRSAAFIGGGTGVGMLIGGLATGGVGLAIGGAAGGGLGTLLAGVTGNRDISIPAESLVRFRLEDSLTVQPAQ